MRPPRRLALTAELVGRLPRDDRALGPLPGTTPLTDADYDGVAARLLARLPKGEDLWLFAYGSLLWRPACPNDGERRARAQGWHRSFCFRIPRFRGTPERPGLMLALDRGGACIGMAQRFAHRTALDRLGLVLRREMSVRETPNQPRWIAVYAEDGTRHQGIAFAADRSSPLYCGRQPVPATVEVLADAIGHVGSCAEYLMRTVERLEELGIHDAYLWRLQAQVAERILEDTEGASRR